MDTVIYILIAVSSVLSLLLYTGRLDVLKIPLGAAFVVSPFVFTVVLLAKAGVIQWI